MTIMMTYMRTTVVIDESLKGRLKGLASKKGLSAFVNRCLHEHFERAERFRRLRDLEKAYSRASKGKQAKEFDAIDREDWPEW